MDRDTIDAKKLKNIIIYISNFIIERSVYLDELDSKTGDGEHGTNLKKGLSVLITKLEKENTTDIGKLLKTTGLTIFSSGSGAGPGYIGYGIMKASSLFIGKQEIDFLSIVDFFVKMKDCIQEKGGAHIGDRTLIDALEPAVLSLMNYRDDGKNIAFEKALESAKSGVENTKSLTPKKGRSFHLGDRVLGASDPGATSISFLFEAIVKYQRDNCPDQENT